MRHKEVLHLLLEWGVQAELTLGEFLDNYKCTCSSHGAISLYIFSLACICSDVFCTLQLSSN